MEAEAIRHYRESKNLTQSQFAALLRVSPTAVTQWEKGQRPAGPASLLLEHLIHGTPLFSADGAADWNMPLTLKEWEDLERQRVRTGFSSVRDYMVWLARRDLEQARQAQAQAQAQNTAVAAAPPPKSAPPAAAPRQSRARKRGQDRDPG